MYRTAEHSPTSLASLKASPGFVLGAAAATHAMAFLLLYVVEIASNTLSLLSHRNMGRTNLALHPTLPFATAAAGSSGRGSSRRRALLCARSTPSSDPHNRVIYSGQRCDSDAMPMTPRPPAQTTSPYIESNNLNVRRGDLRAAHAHMLVVAADLHSLTLKSTHRESDSECAHSLR